MTRGVTKGFVYLLTVVLGISFIGTLALWSMATLLDTPIPAALEPFSGLMSIFVTGLLALASYLGSRRIHPSDSHSLPWNWWWYRYWYFRDLLKAPQLTAWMADFAPLQIEAGRKWLPFGEVLNQSERQRFIDVLKDVSKGKHPSGRQVIILGYPGSGKTTGLIRLAAELARDGARTLGLGRAMPVLIRLVHNSG